MELRCKDIPSWNSLGIIPPTREHGTGLDRAPYLVSMSVFVERFATSEERVKLLSQFLKYRATLYEIGIISGFQWVNGSFVEHIELVAQRSPRDIDVVNFYEMPSGETQESWYSKNRDFFRVDYIKECFSVDAYHVLLQQKITPHLLKQITYWYSMWSHTREQVWKGFIELNLSPEDDAQAETLLAQMQEGVNDV